MLDLVVYGATGDAGRAVCRHLAQKQRGEPVKWAVAGRNRAKLEALVATLGGTGSVPAIVIADSDDAASLARMAEGAKVVFSAAGPYLRVGEPVIAACIEAGAHYADITGEVHWVGEMEKKYGARAAEKGVCIASFCGYDSIPSELSVFAARTALKLPPKRGDLFFVETAVALKAPGAPGAPRGTLATVLVSLGADRLVGFCRGWGAFVGSSQLGPSLRSLLGSACIGWSPHVGVFTFSHFMAWCNVPVVHKAFGGEGPLRYQDRQVRRVASPILSHHGCPPCAAAFGQDIDRSIYMRYISMYVSIYIYTSIYL